MNIITKEYATAIAQQLGYSAVTVTPYAQTYIIGSGSYNQTLFTGRNEIFVGSVSIQKLNNQFSGSAPVNLSHNTEQIQYAVNPSHDPLFLPAKVLSGVSIGASVASDILSTVAAAVLSLTGYKISY